MNDVVVVIRKNNERTYEVCRMIIEQRVPENQIYTIEEKPFYRAVEETLKMGIHSSQWLIAVDADVLLFPETISQMVSKANAIKKDFFFYQGAVLDKFFFGYRPAGPHLYNCKHIPRALELKAGFENDLRPESFVRSRMEKDGYRFVQEEVDFGLHDFEQSYSDIYKKIFRHAVKHDRYMKKLAPLYKRFCELDYDFAIACVAIEDSVKYQGENSPSEQELNIRIKEVLQRLGLVEKGPLNLKKISSENVASDVKIQYLNSLNINENFLKKQRYFRRLKSFTQHLLNQLPY